MTKRIKILHLQPICNVRISDIQEEIIAAFPVQDFEVVNAYLTGTPEESGSGEHTRSERAKYFQFQKKDLKGLRLGLMRTLWKFCREEGFDVVITHRFKAFDIMMKLNKFLNIPHCIAVLHNLDDFNRFYRKLNARLFLDKRWTIVSVSRTVKDYLCRIGYGFNADNVVTINNAIDTDDLLSRIHSREDARSKLGLDNDALVFGTIGRMVNAKGHMYLVQAFKKLYSVNNKVKLVIIGDGKLFGQLQQYVHDNHLQDAVILPGAIVDAKLLMPAFDVFVLSSLVEGFSLVVLEAMAAKLPIIATRVGIVPSVITQADEMVTPKDISQLFKLMEKYSNIPEHERAQIGQQLYQRLIDDFDIKSYRKKYLDLVQSLIQN